MTDQPVHSEEDRIRAAELYAEARKLEAQRDYDGAIRSYAQSLQLCEDPLVEAAYLKLLSTVGPL